MIPDLTVISVSYNSADIFLSSWKNFLETTQLEVIIVDNASADQSGQTLSRSFPEHQIVQLNNNTGYGRGANEGIIKCRTRYALLLNPDLTISKESIAELYETAVNDRDNTAIWAPATVPEDCADSSPVVLEAVCGAAMLFDLDKIKQVGFFDENIFLYSEETDLCYRTRSQGYLIKLCPRLFIQHAVDGSSGHHPLLVYMKSWHFGWSRCYYLNKHDLYSAKYNPLRMYRNYKLKSYINLDRIKRLQYRGQAAGVKAFMKGEKAFLTDGSPQMSSMHHL